VDRGEVRMKRTAVLLATIVAAPVWVATAPAQGRSEEAHHHVIICHRTGSDSNPYVVINIPWTAWSEAHDPASSHAHPPLNGRVDIMLEDPAPGQGTKDGFTAEDCVAGGGTTGGTTTGGTTTGGTTSGGTSTGGTTTGGTSTGGGAVSAGTTGGTTGGVSAAETGGELPFTGLPVWKPLLAGLGLLGFGYLLLRRKARTGA
jgi:hypothetical protein